MFRVRYIAVIAIFLCPFVGNAQSNDEEIKERLAGKTIVTDMNNAEFKLRRNGKITGKAGPNQTIKFTGAWTIRGGKFCRTFSEPESFEGTECQNISFGDGTVTITGRNGPVIWNIE